MKFIWRFGSCMIWGSFCIPFRQEEHEKNAGDLKQEEQEGQDTLEALEDEAGKDEEGWEEAAEAGNPEEPEEGWGEATDAEAGIQEEGEAEAWDDFQDPEEDERAEEEEGTEEHEEAVEDNAAAQQEEGMGDSEWAIREAEVEVEAAEELEDSKYVYYEAEVEVESEAAEAWEGLERAAAEEARGENGGLTKPMHCKAPPPGISQMAWERLCEVPFPERRLIEAKALRAETRNPNNFVLVSIANFWEKWQAQ